MPLQTCEDCKKEISTLAVSCPNCGRPNENAGIVIIEQTQKKWKQWGLLGGFLMALGFAYEVLMAKTGLASMATLIASIALFSIGFLVWIGSGIGRWYHHG